MKERDNQAPFIIVKPYSGQHLGLLLEIIQKNGLQVQKAYGTEKWAEIARQIYQKTIEKNGYSFKVGLEGHIKIVNYFFGNRALVLFLRDKDGKSDPEVLLSKTMDIKRSFRDHMFGGEKLEDIIVLMNLDKVKIGYTPAETDSVGIIGVQNNNEFRAISKTYGSWDFYYFKYIHTPDTLEELAQELNTLRKMGVFQSQNTISLEDCQTMARLKTLIPPQKLHR